MLLLTILILSLLAFVSYRMGGRAIYHPAVAFCSVWAGGLLLLWMVGDFFFPMVPQTLLIFLGGATAFSLGTVLAGFYPLRAPKHRGPIAPSSNRILTLLVLLVVCSVPYAVRWFITETGKQEGINFFAQGSFTMQDPVLQKTPGYSFFGNVVILSTMAVIIAFYEREGHKKRMWIAGSFGLVACLLGGGRSVLAILTFSLLCLDWIKNRRIRWKLFIAVAVIFLMLASMIALYLGKGEANPNESVAENAVPLVNGLVFYAVGGLVGYDRVVRDPNVIPHNWQITGFFVRWLNRLGADFEEPVQSSGFLAIGPRGLIDNVYTIYFAYIDLGAGGMLAMMVFLGFVITIFYRRALLGSRPAAIMYSVLFSGILLSLFADYFFLYFNFLSKLYVVCWLVYSLPGVWNKLRQFTGRVVLSDVVGNHRPASAQPGA